MNNPFNKLKVQRDDEDNEAINTNVKVTTTTTKNQPLFNTNNKPEEKKKVKQRPPKEEKTNPEDNEGFEYVGKLPKKTNKNNVQNSELINNETKPGAKDTLVNDKPHHKRGDKYDNTFKPRTNNKREFERHSGTGRGKEVKKQGAGGRGTWGNANVSAKREIVDYDDTDYYFNKALNPKSNDKENLGETNKETTEEKPKTEVETSKTTDKVEGENKDETKEGEENATDKDGKRRKNKKGDKKEEEVDEKDKLIIPENALTLSELRKKQQETKGTNSNENKDIKVDVSFEPIAPKKDNSSNVNFGKKGKVKNAQVNAKELEVNKYLGNLTVEDNSRPNYNKDRNYDKKKKDTGLKFNEKEFPTLK